MVWYGMVWYGIVEFNGDDHMTTMMVMMMTVMLKLRQQNTSRSALLTLVRPSTKTSVRPNSAVCASLTSSVMKS